MTEPSVVTIAKQLYSTHREQHPCSLSWDQLDYLQGFWIRLATHHITAHLLYAR